jgi:hypothetical protein
MLPLTVAPSSANVGVNANPIDSGSASPSEPRNSLPTTANRTATITAMNTAE